jgi:hypothetical protein
VIRVSERLSKQARSTIKASGITIAAYTRHWFADGKWYGDRCGCPDDRCIGFHHADEGDCGCLPVTLDEARAADVPGLGTSDLYGG